MTLLAGMLMRREHSSILASPLPHVGEGTEKAASLASDERMFETAQFNLRQLLVMLTTCAIAFAMIGSGAQTYLTSVGLVVLLFWCGVVLEMVGLVMECWGDQWLFPSALANAVGMATAVWSLFTGLFYLSLFVLFELPNFVL